ncbi:MAG: HlyD family type I secretion periplasmic adaptor subunit [Pseudomonadota bacterium]
MKPPSSPENSAKQWSDGIDSNHAIPLKVGCAIVGAFLFGFVMWAGLAPLAGATISTGVVAAKGQNLVIQHLEGGIVDEILVREGEQVKKNTPLLKLDKTAATARYSQLALRLVAYDARAIRLEAERDGKSSLSFPAILRAHASALSLTDDIDEQIDEFEKRMKRHRAELAMFAQRRAAIDEQFSGLKAQRVASLKQMALLRDDIVRKGKLLRRGLTNRSQYNGLKRNLADLEGRVGSLDAQLGRARAAIVEIQQSTVELNARRAERAAAQLGEVRTRIAETRAQLAQARNILQRVIVAAPANGVVVSLNKNTKGGVVRPGETVAELLPTGNALIVETRISVADIDDVQVGQTATLRFTTLNRNEPDVPAVVEYVSADRLVDPASGQAYYSVRLKMTQSASSEFSEEAIYPGMPVETFIQTESRTFFGYLIRPFSDSFHRAFRQS